MTTSLSPLKRALLKLEEMESRLETLKSEKRMPIAVIGMGCHFPGSNRDQEAFAELLRRGRCAIQEIPIQRWDLDAWYHPDPEAPGKMYCRHGGFIDQAYDFDASFFGISPREARAMDPQQRLLLETSWRALENALLNPAGLCGSRTGVFVGSSFVDHEAADTPASIDAYTSLGNYRSTAAGRISHILGFHGPNLQLDTACASSLMAVHLACQSLRTGESEIALAGGVNLLLSPQPSIGLCKMKALAVDGKVKVFDAAADGYVRGEGCGMVVLQPLEKALAAGQRVLAVIRGSATNHNGPSAGLTVPNRKAQEDLLRRALDSSGLRAGDIGYVEAHGSGTALGDPLEVGALAAVYGEGRNVDDPLWVGSLKANIGHLEAAAGIAGLIKTILVLQKEEIPPQIHFHKPNPHIPWAEIPLRVPDRLRAWPRGERPHGAAVTSMGISGSNVHLILEEAPEPAPTKPEPGPYLLTLSGKTPAALRALGDRCRDLLEKQGQAHPADICAAGRLVASGFRERLAITADSGEDLRRSLALFSENHTAPGLRRAGVDGRAGIAFAFPDGDPLRTGCGRELFENYPVFRHCLQRCSRRLSLDRPLVEVLYPSVQRGPQPLHPNYAEAARFSLALALAELWRSWGVVPDLVTGSGVQALAAACAAGLFSPEDGLDLVTACNDTQRFDRICDRAVFSQPRCRVVSAPEGPVPGDAIATSDWWRQWVRANDGTIRAFAPEPDISIIMEMGVGSVKTTRAVTRVLPCGLNGRRVLMENLAELYTAGAPIDWNAVSPRTSFNPVSFPGYPFERRTYMPVRTETEPAVTQAKPGDIYDAFAQEPGHAAGREKRRLMRFAPFPTIREGFSCFRFFTDPDEDGFTGIVQQGQEELREMLFRHVDFARCRHVFDFGCGYATDLIHLGTKHPHLHLTGCTLSREQENFACGKLEEAALTERVAVHLKDSAEVTFAERFELIFGIEVAHHIKDKARLLSNLTRHLADDGLLALADFVAATDFSIDQESLSSFLISKAEWLELFEKNGLGVLECVDVSREIANFLHDPDYEKHVDSLADQRVLPRVFHSYDRLGKLMRKGLVAYVLLTVKKCGEPAVAENRRKLEHMTPYSLLSPAHWYYKVTWQPKAPAGREPAAEQSASLQRGAAITVPLEEIALVSLAHALCTMGWSPRPGQEFSARRLQQQLGIIGRYEAYTGLLLQMLRKAGYLGREADTWSVLRELPRGESHRMTAELLERHPVMTHELLLLERITGALPEILRGETRALDLLFPDGDPETIGRLYHNALKLSGMDEVCCDVARKEISARRGPVRILEVGAGTGSLSACLLSHLHAARTSYCFTDISTHFVVEARERFRDFPFMSYAVLDLEREPAEQGFESHTYDIILAANAVHVTTSISATLTRLRRLLAPGGALILLEGIGRRCWSDLIFGLLDNWWDFRDRRLRRDHPLLDLPTWNKVLRRAGFARIDAFGDDSTDDTPAPMAVIRAGETPCPAYSGTWLILAGKHGPARALATLLRGRGELGLLVYPEQDAPCPDADDVVIDIHERNAFSRLVADLSATDHPPLKGVIHMWSLDRTPADRPDDAASMLCGSMFSLVHALAVHQTDRELSIYLVTRGAQQVAGNAVSAEGSPLWGLGTVLAREHPQWWGGLIDLDPKEAAGEAEALLAEMDASGGETRVALRNTGRYVARPAHVALDPVAEYAFHADATYMVTGGLGGLGRHVCRWMVSRGARHLLILGRSAENRNGRAFADALEEMGCRVTLRGVDVSDSEELGRVPADGLDPPLKGLIHAAGSLDDARLADLSRPRMAAVLAPKIQGCWNLHCLTRSMPLDFFVLFSSASVHLGIPGQAAYAAANAFMDALAQQRRQAGLPACSINWGPWSESGMAAGMADDRGSFKGLGRIRPGRGLEILNILLGRDDTGLMVLPADWDRFYQNVRDPFFAELIPPRVETRDSLGPVSAFPRGDRLETFVRERLRDLLQLDGPLDPQLGFREMGLDSFTSLELRNLLQRELGCSLPATLLFDSPTLPALLDRLRKQLEPGRDSETHSEEAVETAAAPRVVSNARALLQEPIAVVGLGCRFPGDAVSPEHFRRLLKEGRNGIIDLPDERWTRGSEAVADRGGFLRDIDLFDASFFSMSPQEADQLDPQHRLLLEVAWQTLEHAAVSPDRLQESNCGVFFGLATFDYASRVLSRNLEEVDAHTSSGAFAATAAGRLSHILGCRGPSMVVDTACSSSLVALHLACQSLRSGESELALAGGVNLMIDPRITSVFQRAGVISEDARCRCFDASANGIVRGEGCGVVLLERLSDARRNGDRILALVHGSAVNHDGRAGSLTAPSGTSQQIVMREALKRAGLKGSQIDYVETHGTGTRLGDPIEMGALGRVYGAERDTSRPLAVGSVKTNIGHLEAAAGIAGFIKTVLALHHGEIPPNLHFKQPSPHIAWDSLPIRVPVRAQPWPSGKQPRYAGVSSFGFSGTNAHVLLGEAPREAASGARCERPLHLLTLSARDERALAQLVDRYLEMPAGPAESSLGDLCFSANAGRAHFSHRIAVVGATWERMLQALDNLASGIPDACLFKGSPDGDHPPRVNLLIGNGQDWSWSGRLDHPGYRRDLDDFLAKSGTTRDGSDNPSRRFALLYSLVGLWRSWGIEPAHIAAHGLGEYVAACYAGVFSIEDALELLKARCRPSQDKDAPARAAGKIDFREPRISLTTPRGGRRIANSDYWTDPVGQSFDADRPLPMPDGPCLEIGTAAQPGWGELLHTLAGLYVRGIDPDWAAFDAPYRRRRVSLPTYPFQRQRYWLKDPEPLRQGLGSTGLPDPGKPEPGSVRQQEVLDQLVAIAARLLLVEKPRLDAPLLEMGADSLVMLSLKSKIKKVFGCEITTRQLAEQYRTLQALAGYIANRMPPPVEAPAAGDALNNRPGPNNRTSSSPQTLESIPRQQMQEIMNRQLQTIERVIDRQLAVLANAGTAGHDQASQPMPEPPAPGPVPGASIPRRTPAGTDVYSPQQRKHLDELITAYTRRTRTSKARAEEGRKHLADRRGSWGFRPSIKQLCYPIYAQSGKGCRITDLDGNEYIDLTMGFGAHFFGHEPEFLTKALEAGLKEGFRIGPRHDLADRVARQFSELTGMERVYFCSTGTEAVMTALRIARAAGGRTKAVVFQGSYHGHFDAALAAARDPREDPGGIPMYPGVAANAVADTLVLEYGRADALEVIEEHGDSLACVLVEPVQSGFPHIQPVAFLKQLRQLTRKHGIVLIFDEVVTGFRCHPGGAQALFGIEADLAVYGKALGGGMPIGAVSGHSRYMDHIDGGYWSYEDDSYPAREMTFSAGTFNKHPLSMAAVQAVLHHLKSEGPALQEGINQRTREFAAELNDFFREEEVPIEVVHFSSFFRFIHDGNLDLLYYHLLMRGVYIWEGRRCFLSCAHDREDLQAVVRAVKDSIRALRDGGFIPPKPGGGGPRPPKDPRPETADPKPGPASFPMTTQQMQLRALAGAGRSGHLSYQDLTLISITGYLEMESFQRAIRRTIARHELLRASVDAETHELIIHPKVEPVLVMIDATATGPPAAVIDKILHEPLDLSRPPGFHPRILKTGERAYILALTTHQLTVDGFSIWLLLREISAQYQAARAGRDAFTEPAPSFRRWLFSRPSSQPARKFWLRLLEGRPPTPALPGNHPRPPLKRHAGNRLHIPLGAETRDQVIATARARQCTVFSMLFSVYAVLLYRLSGQSDLLIGVPAARRTGPDDMAVIGPCLNLLPMRLRIHSGESFNALSARIARFCHEAFDHQEVSYAELLNDLALERNPAYAPLVSALFNYERVAGIEELFDAQAGLLPSPRAFVSHDLAFNLLETGSRLLLSCDYNADLFEEARVRRFSDMYRRLIAAVFRDAGRPVGDLPLLDPSREQSLVHTGTGPCRQPGSTGCIHGIFAGQAFRTPEASAVICDGTPEKTVTYGALKERIDLQVGQLQSLGVKVEEPIVQVARPDIASIAGMLAILEAGGCFVPLDPGASDAHIDRVFQETGARLVLCHEADAARLNRQTARPLLLDRPLPPGARVEKRDARTRSAGTACLVLRSDRVAAVPIRHDQLVRYLEAVSSACRLRPGLIFATAAGPASHLGFSSILLALAAGGCLCLPSSETAKTPRALARYLETRPIDILTIAPTHLAASTAHSRTPDLLPRHGLILMGEAAPARLISRVMKRAPLCRIYTAYGVTEAGVAACIQLIEERNGWVETPLGRPLPGVSVFVLDARLHIVPPGVTGRIFIGGSGLCHGYPSRPDLSAVSFVPDPYAEAEGARLFATNDLGRYNDDGAVTLLGPAHRQLEVGGYQVSPDRVEAELAALPGIETAVVSAPLSAGIPRLTAFVQGRLETRGPLNPRHLLRTRLPRHMVPGVFIPLDDMPRTPSGTLDYEALIDMAASWEQERGEDGPPAAANVPRLDGTSASEPGPIEKTLASFFREVLDTETSELGPDADFLALGGHSIKAMHLINRINRRFGIRASSILVLEHPQIGSLAAAVREMLDSASATKQTGPPLSFSQQRLWFLQRFDGSAAYNIPLAFRLRGPLDSGALNRAFAEITRRHQVLRTVIEERDGVPYPVVGPAPDMCVADLSLLPEPEREDLLERLVHREAIRPFQLDRHPPLRICLLRCGRERYLLLLTLHHIAADAWSLEILFTESAHHYALFLGEPRQPLPELKKQYRDYARQQQLLRKQDAWSRQREYWQDKLAGAPPLLELPSDRTRPPRPTYRGAAVTFSIDPETARALHALGREREATPFMTWQAVLLILLQRYSGRCDLLIGTHAANRDDALFEPLIGCFVNTIVLRHDLRGEPDFGELLERVRKTTLEAFRHQDLPFEEIVSMVAPRRNLSYHPLFQVGFTYLHHHNRELRLTGMETEPLKQRTRTAKWDLSLGLEESGPRPRAAFEYNADLFDADTILIMVRVFKNLLNAVARDPRAPVSSLPLSNPDQQRQQLERLWGKTRPATDSCLHHLFERRAETMSETPAILFLSGDEQETWSFGRLQERAARLAGALIGRGLRPEEPVAVCMPRCPELVASLLAVLMAGGTYLALDPDQGEARMRRILQRVQPRMILSLPGGSSYLGDLPIPVVPIDRPGDERPGARPVVFPDQLAYLAYTSGSSSEPMGVMAHHRGAVNYLHYLAETWGWDRRDTVLQLASPFFDAAVKDILGPLVCGASILMPSDEHKRAPVMLLDAIRRFQVTCIASIVPSFLSVLPELAGEREAIPSVRLVLVSGEVLPPEPADRARRLFPEATLVNQYGPTETTVTTSRYAMPPGEPVPDPVPLGEPIPGTRLYLTADGEPLPQGPVGELHIGGAGVARGYWRRPGLTAAVFVPDPYTDRPGERCFRTGDLARIGSDGRLLFLGRRDRVFKLRGLRIGAAEVETALERHPNVARAAVILVERISGEPRLQAILQWRGGPDEPAAGRERALIDHCRSHLPAHMVPTRFTFPGRLPRTRNGKIDYRALRQAVDPDAPHPGNQPPRSPMEQQLAAIWTSLLETPATCIHDDFFMLGGHSLTAVRLCARIREQFGIDLPLRRVFQHPTLEDLAGQLERLQDSKPSFPAVRREPGPLVLTPGQERIRRTMGRGARDHVFNMPRAFRLTGLLDRNALTAAFLELIRRHEVLRTCFPVRHGRPYVRILPWNRFRPRWRDLSDLEPDQWAGAVEERIRREEARPFRLGREPAFRVTVLIGNARLHVLLLNVHHIVADAWSLNLIYREISRLYAAFSRGEASPLADLPLRYQDYARWPRSLEGHAVLEQQRHWWRRRLKGIDAGIVWPGRRVAREVGRDGRVFSFQLDARLSRRLADLAGESGTTLFTTLLAAFALFLSSETRRSDILITTFPDNRRQQCLEPLVGFFIDFLVLRIAVPRDAGENMAHFQDLTTEVRRTMLDALAHRDLPFDEIVELARKERGPDGAPLDQISFLLHTVPDTKPEFGDLGVRRLPVARTAVKRDLSLAMIELDGVLHGSLSYPLELFEEDAVAAMTGRFELLLKELAGLVPQGEDPGRVPRA